MGRKNVPGRPFLLGTTKKFLEVFGLEKLSDLPSLKEFESLDETEIPSVLKDKIDEEIPENEEVMSENQEPIRENEEAIPENEEAADNPLSEKE